MASLLDEEAMYGTELRKTAVTGGGTLLHVGARQDNKSSEGKIEKGG